MSKNTAIHEAGHAVIAIVLGLSVRGATIIPDGNSAGHIIYGTAPEDTWEKWLERGKYRTLASVVRARIISTMAGAEAERELIGYCDGGDGDDVYQVTCMADSELMPTLSDEWAPLELRMRRQTRRLVKRHRENIKLIANALAERRTLSAVDIAVELKL